MAAKERAVFGEELGEKAYPLRVLLSLVERRGLGKYDEPVPTSEGERKVTESCFRGPT